jgi:hypothetical protein
MKLNKAALKALIKECIIEVFDEGLASQGGETLQESRQSRTPRRRQNRNLPPRNLQRADKTPFNSALDTPVTHKAATSQNIQQATQLVAASGVPQDVMSSLLADTAHTTLVEQDEHQSMGHSAPLDAAGLAMSKIDPLNMPGSNNWALAAGILDDE